MEVMFETAAREPELGRVDNKVVPPENLMSEAKKLAQKILSKSSVALSLAKQAINSGVDMGLPAGLDMEIQCIARCFASNDQKEGMQAFLEKRKPEFTNR